VAIVARNEGFFAADLASPGLAGQPASLDSDRALGLSASAALHGLVLALILVLAPHPGTEKAGKGLGLVPIEVELDWNRAAPGEKPVQASVSPSAGVGEAQPVADALATKLQALARLRQPNADAPGEANGSSASSMMPSSASSPGPEGMYGLKDFILDQVERHWNFNLANLKGAEYSVPIRVEIARSGEVLKAELVDNTRSGDPLYREVALSARNAVLASSPLALPAGHYDNVMEMVLYMNPKDTLR
jgi:hypothetical protein